jgi:hypothetical protein
MTTLVAIAVAVVFLLLSGLHVYWAAGGPWGKTVSVPQRGAEPLFRPSRRATLAVAILLAAAAALVAARLGTVPGSPLDTLFLWAERGLSAIFALRAVGDFHWAGFFKRVRGTPFAKLDTWTYSPLCLLLSLACFYLALH